MIGYEEHANYLCVPIRGVVFSFFAMISSVIVKKRRSMQYRNPVVTLKRCPVAMSGCFEIQNAASRREENGTVELEA